MRTKSPIRVGVSLTGLLLAGVAWLPAQIPASPAQAPLVKPSAAVPTLPAIRPTGASEKPVAAHVAATPHHVAVDFTDGRLTIQATNAGLNEVLREVSHKTGIKITGGVSDDRVFGSYGPSSPSAVLNALLEGTDSNILLVDGAKGGSELVLTPRRGGVTPPTPNASQANDSEDTGAGSYVAPLRPYQVPVANGRGMTPDPQGTAPASEEVESGAIKTPQQIYEQLQKTMQQRLASTPPQ